MGSPGERAGILVGDVLMAIDGKALVSTDEIWAALHASTRGSVLSYSVLRMQGSPQLVNIAVDQTPSGARGLYFALAVVGIFSLLVGAAVRLRRPDHQATLHFFWLSIAFFGMLAFSFSGRLDSLDWVFYWGDVTARLLLPPLFLHFALVFPERPNSWVRSDAGRAAAAAALPAGGAARRRAKSRWCCAARRRARCCHASPSSSSAASCVYLAASLVAGLGDHDPRAAARLLGHGAPAAALDRLGHGARRGAVRRSATSLPFALGFTPSSPFEFTAVLARPGAAGVRVGDRPLPADGRRGDHQARRWSTPRRSRRSRRSTRSC